jgi:FtsH-binding integral membrane protein
MRKAIVVGIAVAAVIAAWKNALDVFTMLVLPCAMMLLLIWGLARLFGLLGLSKWSENVRVALALAVVVGFFLFCGFMLSIPERHVFPHAKLNAEMQGG